MALALRDNAYHTYADYLAWPEDVRYELIDGMAYLMAPAPVLEHQDIAGEIYFQLRRSLEGRSCRAFIAPVDVRLPKGEELDEQLFALARSSSTHALTGPTWHTASL